MKKFLNGILALTASVVVFAVSGTVRAEDKIDELTNSSFGIGAVTNYKDVIFDSLSGASYKANAAGSNGTIQLRSKNSNSGIVTTVSAGHVSKIELKWNAKTTNASSQLDIYGKSSAYSAATELYNTTSAGTLLKSAINGTTTIDLSNESDTAYIGLRSKSGALYLDSIKITWVSDSEETTYDISFNANGGKFANGEGVKITKNVGEKESIDLSKYNPAAPYPYAKLSGWTNGENTYAPADVVEVSSKAIFKAKWEASKILTVEEAIEVANSTGTTQTTIPYTVEGYFVSVDDSNSITIKDSKGNEFVAYAATKGEALEEGDLIRITGYIINYNNKTPEINRGGTYEIVSNANPEDKFAASKVKASLSFDWSSNDKGEYSVSNLKLRFGVMLDSKNTVENGTYGALLISAYDLKSESFTEVIKSYNQTTVDGILASNDKIIKKEVTIKDNVLMCSIDDVKYSDAYYVVFYVISNDTLYLTEERADLVGLDIVDYATNREEYDLTIDEVLALYSLMLESDNSFKEN